jgi:DNA mismatch repair protein MutS
MLADDGEALDEELAAIRYTVAIDGDRVQVHRYEGGDDYRHDVEETFSKFERTEVEDRRVEYSAFSDLNRIEAQILDLVAELFPRPFGRLVEYCTTYREFIDPQVERFDREVQFYLAWLDFISPIRTSGLPFTYPILSDTTKETRVVGSFDIALAAKSGWHSREIVPNDFRLSGAERILVVTGPNQGGKTTFARMFGQLHYLASLGLPVPGSTVELPLPDRLFTIFERQEHIETLRGKLADELVRMRDVFEQATADSVVVVNEGFSSTTLLDAEFVGGKVVERMIEKDLTGVFVTFVDELSTVGEATVSMVATVDPDDPRRRTLRIVRRPAEGRAYAAAIAARYGLSYEKLKNRIGS